MGIVARMKMPNAMLAGTHAPSLIFYVQIHGIRSRKEDIP